MAKKGFARIPNDVLEALYSFNLSAYETRAFLYTLRRTFGWHRSFYFLNVSKGAANIGIKRQHFKRALTALAERNMITFEHNAHGHALVRVVAVTEFWLFERSKQVAFNFEDVG